MFPTMTKPLPLKLFIHTYLILQLTTTISTAFRFPFQRHIIIIPHIIHRKQHSSSLYISGLESLPPPLQQQQQQQQPPNQDIPIIRRRGAAPVAVRYSDFLKLVNADRIEKVTLSPDGTSLLGVDVTGVKLRIEALPNDPDLITELTNHKVDVMVLPPREQGGGAGLASLFQSLLVPAVILAGLLFLFRRSGEGGGGVQGPGGLRDPMGFGKAKTQIQMIPNTGVTFDDVAGCDGAKNELIEVVDFLKQPEAYTANGCRIPRGVILDGPPGTGKTLLAKAVAGEAGVPFLSISGSEFVEMFVGVGASRVRDLFATAKKNAPCIIFIDEIDAVGRQRGAGFAGGNDEREQTINQILVELDGFTGNPGIITIAATNRIDILDRALLRPGRFDRKITVDLPDFRGRTRILAVHARNKPLEGDVDLEAIARRTPGFSGAQLENLMNEAAISSARKDKATVGWEEIDGAVDRIVVGVEKRTRDAELGVQVAKRKELVAYHEAGHAVVGALMPDYDMVQKVTIIPRSNGAGGLTFFSPTDARLESGMYSKHYLESQLAVALGGRLAEEIVYGEDAVTTGASNDFQQVASIAKRMVKEWGMSDKVGRVALQSPRRGGPFMGLSMGQRQTHWGASLMKTVDLEIERLVNNAYLTAKKVLMDNRSLLDHLAKTLVEQETVSAEEMQAMLVRFKSCTANYQVFGDNINRDKLPFQSLPVAI